MFEMLCLNVYKDELNNVLVLSTLMKYDCRNSTIAYSHFKCYLYNYKK